MVDFRNLAMTYICVIVSLEQLGMTYIYVIRIQRVNKVIRKKFFVLKHGFRHQGPSRNNFWKKNFWVRGLLTR